MDKNTTLSKYLAMLGVYTRTILSSNITLEFYILNEMKNKKQHSNSNIIIVKRDASPTHR
jgi:hypothetical protein